MVDKFDIGILRKRSQRVAESLGLEEYAEMSRTECYGNLFNHLRGIEPEKARNQIKMFYGRFNGETEDYFPNGSELGRYMFRIMNFQWFKPNREYSSDELRQDAMEIGERLKIGKLEPFLTKNLGAARGAALDAALDATRGAALSAAWGVARVAAWDTVWDAALDATRGAARGSARGAALGAALDAARGAEYIIASGLKPLIEKYPENPFESLIKVYKKGLWPADLSKDAKKLVIWHPEVVETAVV